MVYILGISCYYHDSSAALLKDGIIVAAAEEERFTRVKHDVSFPINAIKYCLESQNITINDLDYVGFYEKPFIKFERMMMQHLTYWPKSWKLFVDTIPSWLNNKLRVMKAIKKLKYKGDVLFIEHHLAHAASSFLVSPFNEATIVTIDGVGEWTTTAIGSGSNKDIELDKEVRFPHSLGLLYSAITAYLGFSVNNSEFKVMGMAPYGNMTKKNSYYNKLKEVITINNDGSYALDQSYFTYCFKDRMPSQKLCDLLGGPVRVPEDKVTQRHKDIAAAVQLVYEEVLFKILDYAYSLNKCDNLVIAGGCGLNSVANGKILKNSKFKRIWIQPNSSDGGASVGVCSYIYNTILGNERNYVMNNAYLGPEFSDEEIKKFLDENDITYTTFKSDKELLETTAKLILDNQVVGWFQGRMEWGPRALGSRSILANPCNPNAQNLLNEKVKYREKWRPFAPVVCADDALKYFVCDNPIPEATDFMLMVYPIKEEVRKVIPAVTHVDGSGRLQTIRREQNSLYYDLIKKFGELGEIPILINTSFNIRGEPIVCTPYDAYRCVCGTEIDYLVMGNYLIKRDDNLEDAWDSEQYAKD